jgi:hypothetical protein
MGRVDEPLIPKKGTSFQFRRARGPLLILSFAVFLIAFYVMLISTKQSSTLVSIAKTPHHHRLLSSLAWENGCACYTDASVGVSVDCLHTAWKNAGCTNHADLFNNAAQVKWWQERSLADVKGDMAAWASMGDEVHRKGCYGFDKACDGATDATTGVSVDCLHKTWQDAGCTNHVDLFNNAGQVKWWQERTLGEVKGDMGAWASIGDDVHRRGCYGANSNGWPGAPAPPPPPPATAVVCPPTSDVAPAYEIATLDGRVWRNDADALKLNAGAPMKVKIYDGADVYARDKGRVGLFQDGKSRLAVRHSGWVMWTNQFVGGNFDFAYQIIACDGAYQLYNDYGGGHYVGYDAAQALPPPPHPPIPAAAPATVASNKFEINWYLGHNHTETNRAAAFKGDCRTTFDGYRMEVQCLFATSRPLR